jgi:hypothetical protein
MEERERAIQERLKQLEKRMSDDFAAVVERATIKRE